MGVKAKAANVTLGVKTPTAKEVAKAEAKEMKARATLKGLMETAAADADGAQEEAKRAADKANQTRDEGDLKAAEKAEKSAAAARRKAKTLEFKYEESMKRDEELKKLYSNAGKRDADNQSPGKDEDQPWETAGKGAGRKGGRNAKKKTKAEEELEKSLYNEN